MSKERGGGNEHEHYSDKGSHKKRSDFWKAQRKINPDRDFPPEKFILPDEVSDDWAPDRLDLPKETRPKRGGTIFHR